MNKMLLFKFVWRGWFVGSLVLFVPFWLWATFFIPGTTPEMKYGLLALPPIAALQGVLVGALVVLGVTIWPLKTPQD